MFCASHFNNTSTEDVHCELFVIEEIEFKQYGAELCPQGEVPKFKWVSFH